MQNKNQKGIKNPIFLLYYPNSMKNMDVFVAIKFPQSYDTNFWLLSVFAKIDFTFLWGHGLNNQKLQTLNL